jgi:signal transduction histidine kinase
LQAVVKRFVENAHYYTPSGGSITLKAWIEGDFARIEVSDTGIGVPPECQKRLFTKYFGRSEQAVVREQWGLGGSLFGAAYMVRRMGGVIGCQSELEKGSLFWFTIPLVTKRG